MAERLDSLLKDPIDICLVVFRVAVGLDRYQVEVCVCNVPGVVRRPPKIGREGPFDTVRSSGLAGLGHLVYVYPRELPMAGLWGSGSSATRGLLGPLLRGYRKAWSRLIVAVVAGACGSRLGCCRGRAVPYVMGGRAVWTSREAAVSGPRELAAAACKVCEV